MTEVSDSELVTRCRDQHDDAAFGELVRRYQSRVFRLAVSVLGQEFAPDAEDVAQEVFVRAYHGLKTYRSDAAFGTWLYRITFNHASNVKARMRFRAPHLPETALATTASAGLAQDERIDQRREQQLVQACVQELPEVYQSAVRLYYWLGADIAEIATLLDVPENTVKSYLHRARKLLHAQLAKRGLDV